MRDLFARFASNPEATRVSGVTSARNMPDSRHLHYAAGVTLGTQARIARVTRRLVCVSLAVRLASCALRTRGQHRARHASSTAAPASGSHQRHAPLAQVRNAQLWAPHASEGRYQYLNTWGPHHLGAVRPPTTTKVGRSVEAAANAGQPLAAGGDMPSALRWVVVATAGLLGCVAASNRVITVPAATGGSRSDGVVELSYDYWAKDQPVVQWDQALATARQRCGAWGYSDAAPFGGSKSSCQAHDSEGVCSRYFVTVPYQCTGPVELVR